MVDPFQSFNHIKGVFEQDYIRIILATSLAENNLNIQNVRYVIDSGVSREHHIDENSELGC